APTKRPHRTREEAGGREGAPEPRRLPPLPEADERDQDDEDDRLEEARHEEIDLVLHLPRLVGRSRDDQVLRDVGARRLDGAVHRRAELADLTARAHVAGEGDRARALPATLLGPSGELVEELRRRPVVARDLDELAQVRGRAGARRDDEDVADLLLALELARRVDGERLVLRLDRAARRGDVAPGEQ